jgi:hypothetical protein
VPEPPAFDDLFRPDGDEPTPEKVDDGAGHLLDLVAAVDFLRRGDRHGITVWDALEEAIRWWNAETASVIDGVPDPDIADLRWGDPDPLRHTIAIFTTLTDRTGTETPVGLQQAIRRWSSTMSAWHNDGRPWPSPPVTPFPTLNPTRATEP